MLGQLAELDAAAASEVAHVEDEQELLARVSRETVARAALVLKGEGRRLSSRGWRGRARRLHLGVRAAPYDHKGKSEEERQKPERRSHASTRFYQRVP